MNISQKLKNRRKKLGLTMLEVAKRAGVSEATVSRWESGDIANMRRDKIVSLANALQVEPSFIMDYDDAENISPTSEIKQQKSEPPILTKYNKLNHKGKEKTDSYVDDLLDNPKYTKTIESNLDRTVFGHKTYPRAVASPDVTTHIDKRKKKVRHT